MIDPTTGERLIFDGRLVEKAAWIKSADVVDSILQGLANQETPSGVALLAKLYLAIGETDVEASKVPQNVDHIIVLGNALNKDASPKPGLIGRLKASLAAFEVNPGAMMIASGDGETLGLKESVFMKKWLAEQGVPAQSVITEDHSKDTVQNLVFSTDILRRRGPKRVALVTDTSHIARAFALLCAYRNQQGLSFDVAPIASPADAGSSSPDNRRVEQFLLFKDLGRILSIWDYAEWRRPVREAA